MPPLLGTPTDMRRLWKWASVSIGVPLLENMEGRSFPRTFEKREKNFFIYGNFLRNLKCKKKPCKRAAVSIGALFGNLEGVRLLGLLREKENAYLGTFSWTQRTFKGHLEL